MGILPASNTSYCFDSMNPKKATLLRKSDQAEHMRATPTNLLSWRRGLGLAESRTDNPSRESERPQKQQKEDHNSNSDGDRNPPMVRLEALQGGSEGDQAQNSRNHYDRVPARPLPVTPSEVQPHPEFVEGQPQTDSVQHCRHFRTSPNRAPEQQICSDGSEEENPVIQVMNVSPAQMHEKVRYPPRHNQESNHPRDYERQDEGAEHSSRQPPDSPPLRYTVFHLACHSR